MARNSMVQKLEGIGQEPVTTAEGQAGHGSAGSELLYCASLAFLSMIPVSH